MRNTGINVLYHLHVSCGTGRDVEDYTFAFFSFCAFRWETGRQRALK
jgi:hypothetical protein